MIGITIPAHIFDGVATLCASPRNTVLLLVYPFGGEGSSTGLHLALLSMIALDLLVMEPMRGFSFCQVIIQIYAFRNWRKNHITGLQIYWAQWDSQNSILSSDSYKPLHLQVDLSDILDPWVSIAQSQCPMTPKHFRYFSFPSKELPG